ncbi:MAG: energy transducer TonB [Bacteroidota bacterium]
MKTIIAPAAYGYQELRLFHQRYMMLAMLAAILIQFIIVGGYHLAEWLKPPDTPIQIIKIRIGTILPPPSTHEQLLNIGDPIIPSKFSIGIPIPVLECDANPDKPFAGQDDLGKMADEFWKDINKGPVQIEPPINPPVDPDPLPGEYKCIERVPEVVMTSVPEYPELAKRIGLEGSVTVNVLLDKEGKVKKALLMKSTDYLFTQAALEAAKKWIFTPAIMSGKPVLVWVAIPFRFRLAK